MQSVDLIVTNIDWLINVDPARRIIRDAPIAVNGGKSVALDTSAAKESRPIPPGGQSMQAAR